MTGAQKREWLANQEHDVLLCDGLDDALVGIIMVFNQPIALYSKEKCIEVLMKRDGMTWEEASEFLEFNTYDAYVGAKTPAFVEHLFEALPETKED